MADGNTYQEALAMAERIIDEWIGIVLAGLNRSPTCTTFGRPETAKSLDREIPKLKGRLMYA